MQGWYGSISTLWCHSKLPYAERWIPGLLKQIMATLIRTTMFQTVFFLKKAHECVQLTSVKTRLKWNVSFDSGETQFFGRQSELLAVFLAFAIIKSWFYCPWAPSLSTFNFRSEIRQAVVAFLCKAISLSVQNCLPFKIITTLDYWLCKSEFQACFKEKKKINSLVNNAHSIFSIFVFHCWLPPSKFEIISW